MRLRPHGRLGPYELESAIGEGGLGEVWKARNASGGRTVALRILPTPPPGHPFRFARFDDDVRKLIALRHPNVARVYDLIEADDLRALACEWVVGESLAQRLATSSLPVNDAIGKIAQMANGLAAAHTRDLVHGDVKPSNIALCADGTVKVLDVGLVEVYDPGGSSQYSDVRPAPSARLLGTITGTAAYMSPEQIAGGAADSRADVWAFGCVVFETLTGKPAFAADDLDDTMSRISGAEPEWTLIPPAAPAPLVGMLRRCLEKDATRRFQRMTEVLAPIRAAIGEEGALDAFLKQSAWRRMSRTHFHPDWTDETVWNYLEKSLPTLRRWAHDLRPSGYDVDIDDVVQDVIVEVARRINVVQPHFHPRHAGLLQAYLRECVLRRIRDEVRRQERSSLEEFIFTSTADYGEAFSALTEREQEIVKSRLEDGADYKDIAARYSFPTTAAARKAVTRALRKLADLMSGKKRD